MEKVIDELQGAEGADIPVDMSAESMENPTNVILSIRPTRSAPQPVRQTIQTSNSKQIPSAGGMSDLFVPNNVQPSTSEEESMEKKEADYSFSDPETTTSSIVSEPLLSNENDQNVAAHVVENESVDDGIIPQQIESIVDDGIPREEIMKFINDVGLLSYDVRTVRISNYLSSLFSICRFLSQTGLNAVVLNVVKREVITMIHDYTEELRLSGKYDNLANKVMEFKLASQAFDVFGNRITDNPAGPLFSATDTDLDRQLRLAVIIFTFVLKFMFNS